MFARFIGHISKLFISCPEQPRDDDATDNYEQADEEYDGDDTD
jgi:hypothetical protein